ncbi:MAG: dipeptidase [Planctomycetota bacterium]
MEEEKQLRNKADELAQKLMILDTHQDTPWQVQKKEQDISQMTSSGDFDYPRARAGGLDAVFMAAYIPPDREEDGTAFAVAEETIDMIESWPDKWPDEFVLARSPAELKQQFGSGKVSIIIAIENGAPIEGKLENLRHFYDRGVRYITPVHSKWNHICDSSFDEEREWKGLSPFGKELVNEMNRIGMIIDVSHVSDDTFFQIIELSKAPVVATHSSCRALTPRFERNMSDEMIKLLAENGGVIQINFGSIFVSKRVNKGFAKRRKHVYAHIDKHGLIGDERDAYVDKYIEAHPIGDAEISDVVANIDHVVKLVGIDHVGLGSDFDGVDGHLPPKLKDVSCYPNLIYELLKRDYTEEDIEKLCSANFLRVWSKVQEVAANL